MNYYQQLITAYTFDNIPLLAASAVTFGFGFLEYIYSFRLVRREGSGPFPVWMHTFYFAHDSSWAVFMFLAAREHDWNWFLLSVSAALLLWTLFETYCLIMVVRVERNEVFGAYFGQEVTIMQAVGAIFEQILAFYMLVNILIQFMGEGSFMQWALLTNMLMAVAPGVLWLRRSSRIGSGLGIALVIFGGTVNTFLPTGMFVLALPGVFDTVWFYVTGIVLSAIAAANVVMVAQFDAKQISDGQKRPIW
ncbi:hypothetical protein ACFQ71_41990 [Streptomyces sp. NPDC056534]|uniref:hypothetical protein n=1 Tax=Streptomyces sp. NPDC056534 TaxID=3345857 RepID=UPI00368A2B99